MESPGRVELPAAFEEAEIESLALLIGDFLIGSLKRIELTRYKADMLERLMAHNDRIPLLP